MIVPRRMKWTRHVVIGGKARGKEPTRKAKMKVGG
jgi:hypothetical protein